MKNRAHICAPQCDRKLLRQAHERSRMNRRAKVKAKLKGKRAVVRPTTRGLRFVRHPLHFLFEGSQR